MNYLPYVMYASVVLVGLLAIGAFGAPHESNRIDGGRIIGGELAQPGQIPYIISLKYDYSHICGGSILDRNHVLTAAHCVPNTPASDLQIQYGSLDSESSENIIQVTNVQSHQNYTPSNGYANDIAVLTLERDIQFNKNVQPTKLPSKNVNYKATTSRLSGWGLTENGGVQKWLLTTTLPFWNDEDCERLLPKYQSRYHYCAGDLEGTHKQCSGDSGGPLVDEKSGVQLGIVSWSYKPCTIRDHPGIFTRLPNYLDWIKEALKN